LGSRPSITEHAAEPERPADRFSAHAAPREALLKRRHKLYAMMLNAT